MTAIVDCQPQLEALCEKLRVAAQRRNNGGKNLGVGEGRNNELTRRLGLEVAKGVAGAELARRAHELNDFDPPLDEAEVEKVLRSAAKWPRVHRCTDSGNAERLIDAFGDRIRYCPAWGAWLAWDGRRWAKDDVLAIEHYTAIALLVIYEAAAAAFDEKRRERLGKWALRPCSASAAPRLIVVVVLPTPPF